MDKPWLTPKSLPPPLRLVPVTMLDGTVRHVAATWTREMIRARVVDAAAIVKARGDRSPCEEVEAS